MKWRDVKILCAGMCVCTVFTALQAVQNKEGEDGAGPGEVIYGTEEICIEETELMREVHVERHKVYGVGNGITNEEMNDSNIEETDLVDEVRDETEAQTILENNLIIADVTNYVNIRSMPSEEGEILGKLYDDSIGRKLGEENDWYYIESGSVKGYVKAEFVLIGEEAEIRAKEVGTRLAEVTTTTLKVRKEPTTEAAVLGLVPGGDILAVLEELEGWIKIEAEEGIGYVSTDYVRTYTENVEAESRAEEEARLKREEEARREAEEAAKEALRKQQAANQANKPTKKPTGGNTGSSINSSNTNSGNTGSSSTTDLGQQIADYAMRFVGNPYVYGGTSLTNGADCSGFVQSVYKHFGISLPRHSGDQGKSGRAVNGLNNAKAGDLVWYSGHIGIYIGNGKIVHASNEKNGIMVSEASYRTILGIRRII